MMLCESKNLLSSKRTTLCTIQRRPPAVNARNKDELLVSCFSFPCWLTILDQDIMDPTDLCRVVDPWRLQLTQETLPFKASSRILFPDKRPTRVNSVVGNQAHFPLIDQIKWIEIGAVGTCPNRSILLPIHFKVRNS